MKMNLYGEVEDRRLIASYSEIEAQDKTLSVMTLNTIFTNKLGLLIDSMRNESRDFFDIWFLLQRTDQFDFNPDNICKLFKAKYGFYPSFVILKKHLDNRFLKANWSVRLSKQLAELPDIEIVISDLKMKLERFFSL